MCVDPVSLAAIGSTIASSVGGAATAIGGNLGGLFSLASGAVGAVSTYANGRAQASALKIDAANQEKAGKDRYEQGEKESDRRRRAGAIQRGEQRAALAANGVDVEGENAIDILDDTSTLVAEDAFSIREAATQDTNNLFQQSANSRTAGSNAKSQGTFGAISTVLSTGAKVGSKWKSYSNKQPDAWRGLRTAAGSY